MDNSRPMRESSEKVVGLDAIASLLAPERASGAKVAQCHGVFDIVHPGHIQHLQEAASQADVLVVTITSDRYVNRGPGRPVFGEKLRASTLAALEFVKFVVIVDFPEATEAIEVIKPDVYAKGSDYADAKKDLTGKIETETDAVVRHGGKIYFTAGDVYSSSNLANRFFSSLEPDAEQFLSEMRQHFSSDDVLDVIDLVSSKSVLVIGETIIDHYTYSIPLAKAPREFILAAKALEDEVFAGGSAAVANHVAGIAKNVTLVSIFGSDEYSGFTESRLASNVELKSIICPGRPTTRKQRFLDPNFYTKMFEIQYIDDSELEPELDRQLLEILAYELPRHDIVLVSDFGHGMMSKAARELVSSSEGFVGVNTQTNSANYGYNTIDRYQRANYVSIDLPELQLAARDKHSDPALLASDMAEKLHAEGFMVTMGREGSVYTFDGGEQLSTPAFSHRILDRVGAGDAFFAISAPCVAVGAPAELVGFIGNCAGAMAVEIVGNRVPIDPVGLKKFVVRLLK